MIPIQLENQELLTDEKAREIYFKNRYGQSIVIKQSKIEPNKYHIFDVAGEPVRIALGRFEEVNYFIEEYVHGENIQIPKKQVHFIEVDLEEFTPPKKSFFQVFKGWFGL